MRVTTFSIIGLLLAAASLTGWQRLASAADRFSIVPGDGKTVKAGYAVFGDASVIWDQSKSVNLSVTVRDKNGDDVTNKEDGIAVSFVNGSSLIPTSDPGTKFYFLLSSSRNTPKQTYKVEITGTYVESGDYCIPILSTLQTQTVSFNLEVSQADPIGGFDAVCSPNQTARWAWVGENVQWDATVSGGQSSFTYSWRGTDGLSGSANSVSKTYLSLGEKHGEVKVVDSTGRQVVRSCSSAVLIIGNSPSLDSAEPGTCSPGNQNTITLSWTPPDRTANSVIGYKIVRNGITVDIVGSDTLSYVDCNKDPATGVCRGFSPSTDYRYSVKAAYIGGDSLPSNTRSAMSSPLCPVKNVKVNATNPQCGGFINVEWDPALAYEDYKISQYKVHYGTSAGSLNSVYPTGDTNLGVKTPFKPAGSTFNQTFYFKVSAVYLFGGRELESPLQSTPVSGVTSDGCKLSCRASETSPSVNDPVTLTARFEGVKPVSIRWYNDGVETSGGEAAFTKESSNPLVYSSTAVRRYATAGERFPKVEVTDINGEVWNDTKVGEYSACPTITVKPGYSFGLSCPATLSVAQGNTASGEVGVSHQSGDPQPITIGAAELQPTPEITYSLTPSAGTPNFRSFLRVFAGPTAPVGTRLVTISGVSEDTKTKRFCRTQVTVTSPGAAGDLQCSASIVDAQGRQRRDLNPGESVSLGQSVTWVVKDRSSGRAIDVTDGSKYRSFSWFGNDISGAAAQTNPITVNYQTVGPKSVNVRLEDTAGVISKCQAVTVGDTTRDPFIKVIVKPVFKEF